MQHVDTLILAADFFDTSIGGVIQSVMRALAVLFVIGAAFKSVKHVSKGELGKVAQIVIGTAAVATFMWQPSLIGSIIEAASNIMGKGIQSADEIANNSTR